MAGLKVLIGGGTGFIGKHLHAQLKTKGYEVINISRKAAAGAITWNDVQRNGLPDDTYAVVNLAGHNIMDLTQRWSKEYEESVKNSRLQTTQQLAQAVSSAASPPKVFVSSSAVGFYPPSETKTYDETFEGERSDFFTSLSMDWESSAKLPDSCETRSVIVRIGLALGRDGGTIQNMILPFWFGVGGRLGSGSQWFPWVHVDDVASIFKYAIENENVQGPINAVAPESATNSEFTQAFASALWRPAIFPAPGFVIRTVLAPERAKLLLEGQKVLPKKILEAGYKFQFPDLKSACKEFGHLF